MPYGLPRLVLATVACSLSLTAQSSIFSRATPDAENALRTRITGFFEAQQQGKWRQAQQFVSEDSIDAYLERDKVRYENFEIREVTWDKDYKEATVTMIVPYKMDVAIPGITEMPTAPRPLTHHWRMEEGDWFWFVPKVDPCAPVRTPLGEFTPECKDGKPIQDADIANSQKALDKMIAEARASVDPTKLQARVTISNSRIAFSRQKAGAEELILTNNFDGPVNLELIGPPMGGLNLTLEGAKADTPRRLTMESKTTAKLRVAFEPGEKVSPPDKLGMQIIVEPIHLALPLEIVFE